MRELSAGNVMLWLGVVEVYWTALYPTSTTSTKVPNCVADAPIWATSPPDVSASAAILSALPA